MSWTTLDLNNLLAGEPLIEAEVLALYQNPISIAEGAPGAPRLYGLAAVPNSNLAELAVLSVSESNDWILPEANIIGPLTGVFRVVTLSGTLRFSVQYSTTVGAIGTLELRRNGIVLQSWTQTDTVSVTRVLDAASTPTDEWQWVIVPTQGTGGTLSSRQVGASDSYTRIGVPIRRSDL